MAGLGRIITLCECSDIFCRSIIYTINDAESENRTRTLSPARDFELNVTISISLFIVILWLQKLMLNKVCNEYLLAFFQLFKFNLLYLKLSAAISVPHFEK